MGRLGRDPRTRGLHRGPGSSPGPDLRRSGAHLVRAPRARPERARELGACPGYRSGEHFGALPHRRDSSGGLSEQRAGGHTPPTHRGRRGDVGGRSTRGCLHAARSPLCGRARAADGRGRRLREGAGDQPAELRRDRRDRAHPPQPGDVGRRDRGDGEAGHRLR